MKDLIVGITDRKLVCSVGLYERGTYVATINKNPTKEYTVWTDMLRRCYSKKQQDRQPTYQGCTVSENFKNFQFFAEWCNNQIGFGRKGWALDKDILVKGNKVYSETTCCFVPRPLNGLFTLTKKLRGLYPIGVTFSKEWGKYVSHINFKHKTVFLGYFACPEAAFYAYKKVKELHIRDMASRYKDEIDYKVYQCLLNWEMQIDD